MTSKLCSLSAPLSLSNNTLEHTLQLPPDCPPVHPPTMDQPPQHTSWTKVSSKRGRSSPDELERVTKHVKDNQHWLHPPSTSTSNRYSPLEEADGAASPPPGPERPSKPPPIFIQDVTTIPPLLLLLEQVAPSAYETKALSQNQVKVQPQSSEAYRAIVHALNEKQTNFHTYKPKEDRNYRVVLKHMHYSIEPTAIKEEIENLGHKVVSVWNIKQARTKLPLPMFFVDLKPAPTNKDIYQIEYLHHCKIAFEPPHRKRDIVQCANCQRYGHTKNYCHLKPRCVKCAGDHLTLQCHRKDRSSEVRCVLCGGNHPANYKGCTVYKDLQLKTFPSLRPKLYTPRLPSTAPYTPIPVSPMPKLLNNFLLLPALPPKLPPPQPNPPTSDIQDLTKMINRLFEQMGSLLHLLTTVLAKLP